MAAGPVKDIEMIDTSISFTQAETKCVAYLCVELKNHSAKNIANLNLEISYYDINGHPIKKVVLKNRLAGAIPSGETRKYKILLNGDVFNDRYEEYPYSRRGDVEEFDVKILK